MVDWRNWIPRFVVAAAVAAVVAVAPHPVAARDPVLNRCWIPVGKAVVVAVFVPSRSSLAAVEQFWPAGAECQGRLPAAREEVRQSRPCPGPPV